MLDLDFVITVHDEIIQELGGLLSNGSRFTPSMLAWTSSSKASTLRTTLS
ncbi:MAG: hypothetical protein H0W48_12575 [Methylibium sp.]|nr:hypothetical protein [Methylibium sp.]